jgi:hypothetical protein
MSNDPAREDPVQIESIGWLALVARWVEIARASRAIPASDARLRDSIPELITIEATTAALGELGQLPAIERPHARVVAEVTIRRAARTLDQLWRGEEWPAEFLEACEVAERALRLAIYAGLEEFVVDDVEPFTVPDLELGFTDTDPTTHIGTLAVMPPGSIAMPSEPVAWWCGRQAPSIQSPRLSRRPAAAPTQVYRVLDERGRFVEDIVASLEDDLAAGLPMLTPLLLDGVTIGRFLHAAEPWEALQRRGLDGRSTIPVRRGDFA